MHFLVVGPGAMGCLFASRLKMAGNQVELLDYRPERAMALQHAGIKLEEGNEHSQVKIPIITENPRTSPDALLVCVKAGTTRAAIEKLVGKLPRRTPIITLQNGLGNKEILLEMLKDQHILGGITAEGATLLGPGHVRHAGKGNTVIGPLHPFPETVKKIVSVFQGAGFNAEAAEDIDAVIWGKLIINVGINALTAITRLRNGTLPEVSATRRVMKDAVAEAVSVAHAKGIQLPYHDPLKKVIEVCNATAGNRSSMLQDILVGKTTEVQFINGAVARQGEETGIATPVNNTLTSLVEALQETANEYIS